MTYEALGHELLRYRKLRRMSRVTLAKRAGVCETTVFNLEHARHTPSFFVLTCITDALGIDCAFVITDRTPELSQD